MVKDRLRWIMLMLSLGITYGVCAQGEMIIKRNGGEFKRIPMENVRKLTFPNEKLEIALITGSEQLTFPLSEIMLVFSGVDDTHSKQIASASNLKVYLQADVLYISNGQQELGKIQLFDTRGWLIETQYNKENMASMNVSGLPAGVYILKVENTVVKFFKW